MQSIPSSTSAVEAPQHTYSSYPQREHFAPWVTAGSIILFIFGIVLIVFTFVESGDAETLWGYLASGIILTLVAIVGVVASRSTNKTWASVFFWIYLAATAITILVLVINSAKFKHYMNERCSESGFSRYTLGCAHIREYYLITLHAFAMFFFLWGPTFLIVVGHFWYYSKYPFGKQ